MASGFIAGTGPVLPPNDPQFSWAPCLPPASSGPTSYLNPFYFQSHTLAFHSQLQPQLYLFLVLICVTRPCNVLRHVRRDISRRFIIIIYLFIIMNRITNRIDSNRELECSSGHRRKHTCTEARTDRRTTRKHNAICKLVGDTTTTTITIAIRN